VRDVLRSVQRSSLENVSLGYDAWAPVGADGKVPDDERPNWLAGLACMQVSPDYQHFFDRWRASFSRPGDRLREVTLADRLLVGHGNSSAAEVGLVLHHTWGVPIVPGSALKGLLAHYVEATYGPDDPNRPPWSQPDGEERERSRYQGVTWKGRRIQRGPGDWYRSVFGAPDAEEDDAYKERGLEHGASRGKVMFHDALYVPGSAENDRPYAVDVLTVHQKPYYDDHIHDPSAATWPSDFADPNPVAFLTVRPGVRLLLAVSGPPEWTETVEQLLLDALERWGVGAKTSAGYGRIRPRTAATPGPQYRRGERITVTRVEDPGGRQRVRFLAPDGIPAQLIGGETVSAQVGETIDLWVANVSPQIYTLTARAPGSPGAKGGGSGKGKGRKP
jgi:CRISPR-associated protein Cmr6